jgi:rare lipoprotein A
LPFGTLVRVTNLENNKQVVVKINDRGPYVAGRVIDLSRKAAEEIDMLRQGIVEVKLEVLK